MTPFLRKLNLTAHITSSVGWFGAVAGFLVLCIAGLTSQDAQRVRAAYLGMELIAWCVIVPLSFASPLTGIIQSLGTTWGLFRHYWIMVKFLVTLPCTGLLVLHVRPIGHLAAVVAQTTLSGGEVRGLQIKLLVNAGAALLVLLVATTLSVYKPWGTTRYGRRKQQQERRETLGERSLPAPPALPDPENVTTGDGLAIGIIIILALVVVLVAAFVVLHLTGGGLGSHGH
jgi:hypothetical protein